MRIVNFKLLLLILLFISVFTFENSFAAVYPMPEPGNDIIGSAFTVKVERGDTVATIRMRYGISEKELLEANPKIKNYRIVIGDSLIIPTRHILPIYRKGIVLNMAELRVYYFASDGQTIYTFPVAMGRPNWRTPTMISKIVRKEEDPIWYAPKSVQAYMLAKHNKVVPDIVMPGPENPLGKYALYLARNGYLLHGTNEQPSVGTYASSGCMRLSEDSVELLYEDVPIGTPVYIIHHPNKAGWYKGELYLESDEPINDINEPPSELNTASAEDAIEHALEFKSAKIDWARVREVVAKHDGLPHVIGEEL